MKTRKLISLFLIAALVLALLAGCTAPAPAAPAEPTAPAEPAAPAEPTAPSEPAVPAVSVTDMTGAEVTLEAPATRVVALTASNCEILYAIGAGDTIVGRGEYCDWPAEVLEIPSVQSGAATNVEQIIALEPQLVLMTTMDQSVEQVEALKAAGIAVASFLETDINGVYDAIEITGALTGHETEAAAVTESMKDAFAELSANAAANAGKTVYFEVSPLEWGLWTAGSATFMDEIATLLGLTNCFADVQGWGEISEEQVLERDPDYIVTISMYYGEGPTPTEEILAREGWGEVTAVKNSAILNLQNNELSRPVPRLAEGAKLLAEFVSGN